MNSPLSYLAAAAFVVASYVYSYSINMTSTARAWYIVTNLISGAAWVVLVFLIHAFRVQAWKRGSEEMDGVNENGTRLMIFAWIKPVTYSMKFFCGLSAIRYFVNIVVLYWHIYFFQNSLFFLTNLSLAIAVGYASVYYKRIPKFMVRIKRHQLNARRFELIAENVVDVFLEVDTLGNIWYANHAAAEVFQKTSSRDLLGHDVNSLFQPFPAQSLGIEEFLETGKSDLIDCRVPTRFCAVRSDGTSFPVELTISHYEVGAATRFCIVMRDISVRAGLEQKIKENEQETL